MPTNIEYTNEFGQWYSDLGETQQDDVASVVGLLEAQGTKLGFPYSSKINGSKHSRMREQRSTNSRSSHPNLLLLRS